MRGELGGGGGERQRAARQREIAPGIGSVSMEKGSR